MSAKSYARRSEGAIVMIIVGSIAGLFALGLLVAGGVVLWADQTQRDSAGYFTSDAHSYKSGTYAITHDGADITGIPSGIDVGGLARIRIKATSENGHATFVGIARERDVDAYLANVSHSKLRDFDLDPFRAVYDRVPGAAKPAPPASQTIWVASAKGSGTKTLTWRLKEGTWSVVAMNADGSAGVAADVSFGADIHYLTWIWAGMLGLGALLVAIGVFLIVRGSRTYTALAVTTGSVAAAS